MFGVEEALGIFYIICDFNRRVRKFIMNKFFMIKYICILVWNKEGFSEFDIFIYVVVVVVYKYIY